MKHETLKKLILTAIFAALTCVATWVIKIPSPTNGYFNLGDCMVILGALVLGPWWGALAGGLGSALTDLFAGYFVYAPATLIIKALMAVFAALVFSAFRKRRAFGLRLAGAAIGAVAAECMMVAGYFLYEMFIYDPSAAALAAVGTNLPQGGVGVVASLALFVLLDRTGLMKKFVGGEYGVN